MRFRVPRSTCRVQVLPTGTWNQPGTWGTRPTPWKPGNPEPNLEPGNPAPGTAAPAPLSRPLLPRAGCPGSGPGRPLRRGLPARRLGSSTASRSARLRRRRSIRSTTSADAFARHVELRGAPFSLAPDHLHQVLAVVVGVFPGLQLASEVLDEGLRHLELLRRTASGGGEGERGDVSKFVGESHHRQDECVVDRVERRECCVSRRMIFRDADPRGGADRLSQQGVRALASLRGSR